MGNHIYAGAEWIGSVPEHWKFYKGKIIFGESNEKGNDNNLELLSPTQKYGVIPQTLYEQYTTLRTVKVKEDTDLNTFKTVHKGDFCISLRSFQGGFEYSEYEGVVSPAYHILYSKCPICDGYYKYLFKEQSFIAEMNSYCQTLRDGKNISYSDFGKTLIPYPPINEQQSIANYLDDRCSKIDAIIAEAKASIEEYKELKQAVIYEAVTKGLDKNVEMKDSGVKSVGKIPSYWEFYKLNLLSNRIGDGLHGTPEYDDFGEVFFINGNNLGNKNLEIKNNTKKINFTEAQKYKVDLGENTLLISLNGTIGSVSKYDGEKIILGKSAGYINLRNDVNRDFIRYYLQSPSTAILFDLERTGTTIFNLSLETLRNLKICIPPSDEQERIANYLDEKTTSLDTMISEKQSLIEDLESYKKSLIYEVVTGKRKVVE